MAFIAIDARADGISTPKKGKLTPAQHAQLNAFCLSGKTGIFDISYTQGSTTAYNRCEATASTPVGGVSTITFKKGYIAICGRIVECEEATTLNITLPTSGSVEGYIILRYNLNSTGDAEFELTTTQTTLVREDLNANPLTAIYEFPLYKYTATTSGVTLTRNAYTTYIEPVSTVLKKADSVQVNSNQIKLEGTQTASNCLFGFFLNGAYNSTIQRYDFCGAAGELDGIEYARIRAYEFDGVALYASEEDRTRRLTIAQRLSNLGFKAGTISSYNTAISGSSLQKIGYFVIGYITFNSCVDIVGNNDATIGTIPSGFRPSEEIVVDTWVSIYNGGNTAQKAKIRFCTDGTIKTTYHDYYNNTYKTVYFGWDTSGLY